LHLAPPACNASRTRAVRAFRSLRLEEIAMCMSLVTLLSACATTPEVTYNYYPSRSETTITLTQTIACNTDGNTLVVSNQPGISTLYSADHKNGPFTLRIKALDGFLADSDINIDLYDDGRLKGINANTTGEGEAVIKSAITLATAVATNVGRAGRART